MRPAGLGFSAGGSAPRRNAPNVTSAFQLPKGRISRCLALFFRHGLELAFEIEPGNLALHGTDQAEVHSPGSQELIHRLVFFPRARVACLCGLDSGLRAQEGRSGNIRGRRESYGLQAKSREEKAGAVGTAGLRQVQGIVVAVIKLQSFHICGGIVLVIVGPQNIDRWSRGFPDAEHVVGGAAALVGAGSARQAGGTRMQRVAQGRVGHHGQRINGLSRLGHLPHVSGHRPGVEVLVRIGTKSLLPVWRWRSGCQHAWP